MENDKDDKEIEELASQIRSHNQRYWVDHKPSISDAEYDKLVEKLRSLSPFHDALTEFAEDSSDRPKVKHKVPMLSLEKAFSAEEVLKLASNCNAFGTPAADGPRGLVATYKIDGLSCSLLYEGGKLVRAATRGSGEEGDDITPNARVIAGIPRSLTFGGEIEVRGEIYMTKASFRDAIAAFEKKLADGKAKDDDRPSNPRNYCAGSVKQKDPNETKRRNLSFMAHGAVLKTPCKSEEETFSLVETLGFETPFFKVVHNKDEVEKAIADIGIAKEKMPYDIDGAVFAANSVAIQREMGFTSHHPRFKIAFKFARDRGETTVTGINWNTSRNGRVVPQVELKPISLGGATVTFCTGHNAKTVLERELCAGDTILMEREVIPYLVEKTSKGGKAVLPEKCSSCGTALEWEDEKQVHLLCPNIGGCPAQLQEYLCHYVSRKVVNVVGVGEELIEKLIAKKLVKSPADLFRITKKDILDNIERQGESSAEKTVAAIQERREQPLATFLYSLGIAFLGETMSGKLAEKFGTLDAVLAAKKEDVLDLEKVGDKLATIAVDGLASRKALIKDLLAVVKITTVKKAEGSLSGKSFCLTGHVEVEFKGKKLDSRPDIEDAIKFLGGTIKGVSKGLAYLVAGEDAGSKLEKAGKLGIKVIGGKELEKMLKG